MADKLNIKALGSLIMRLRVEAGLSQDGLASRCREGYPSRSQISRLEVGKPFKVDVTVLDNLAEALQVNRADMERLAYQDKLPTSPQSYLDYLLSLPSPEQEPKQA